MLKQVHSKQQKLYYHTKTTHKIKIKSIKQTAAVCQRDCTAHN